MADPYAEFLQHFAKHHDRLFGYIYSLLPNRADAEDVFQRTSLVLWQKFDRYDPGEPFFPWACGVAFYEVRNFLRVNSRERLRFNSELLGKLAEHRPKHLGDRDHRLSALAECLETLRRDDRQLVDHAYRSERTLKDLAGETGKAVQTLYNRLNQIRRRLLDCVDRRMREAEAGAET